MNVAEEIDAVGKSWRIIPCCEREPAPSCREVGFRRIVRSNHGGLTLLATVSAHRKHNVSDHLAARDFIVSSGDLRQRIAFSDEVANLIIA